jgi:hypothetical protein
LTEEKSMELSINTSISMLSSPVSAQSTFCSLKKQIKPELECLRFLVLDQFKCSEKVSWKALPNQWGSLECNATFSSGFCYGMTRNSTPTIPQQYNSLSTRGLASLWAAVTLQQQMAGLAAICMR